MRVKTYDLSTRIIFVHSETRVTIPLEVDGSLIGKQGRAAGVATKDVRAVVRTFDGRKMQQDALNTLK